LPAKADGAVKAGLDEFGVGVIVFSHDGEAAFGFVEYIPEVIEVPDNGLPQMTE
jgi:hypothetical protein